MRKTIYSFVIAACYCLLNFGAEATAIDEGELFISTYVIKPADNSTGVNIRQTFSAYAIANASQYTFQFSIPYDFSSNVLTYESSSNTVAVTGLKYATKYYARVKTNLNSSYGKITSFTTRSSEAYAFVSKPANGSVGNDAAELKVTANFVDGAKRYTIELNTASDFSGTSIVLTSTADNQRTLAFTGLQYLTTYYARVKTDLSDTYGKVISFTTRAEQFSYVSEPANNASAQDFAIMKVVVAPVYQARRYVIELSTTPDFSNVLRNKSLTDLQRTFVFENLKPQTTYYARAKTDVSTDFGKTTTFTTHEALSKHRVWGVTTSGGVNGAGTVFSFSVDSLTYTKHHDNTSTEYLHGQLVPAPGGNFYGMGIQYSTGDAGEVYKIDNQGNYSVVYNNGGLHFGSLMLASNNVLYVIDDWTNSFRGGIWKINPNDADPNTTASVLHKFRSDTDGKNPIAAPIELDGFLYGMAPNGGMYKKGVIYRKKFDGTTFQVLYHFDGVNGASPQGRLVLGSDGYLYGLTFSGGASNYGTIFKVKPDGSSFTKLFDFNGANGRYPFGDLIQNGSSLYGMTSEGGSADNGVIFKVSLAGAYTKLFDFAGSNGAIPMGSLTADNSGVLYGMTANGGANDLGVIFKINNSGTAFTKLYDFSDGGGNPDGTLVLVEDTFGAGNAARAVANVAPAFKGENQIRTYPNPFVNTMTVELTSPSQENFTITLSDLSGRVVYKEQSNQSVQLGSNLPQGIYIMKVVSGTKILQQRVVKQ